ncbi:hypothetical protein J8L13_09650 [Bacteroides fragilis]|uniref:hypothetical protein n=1 Tax=Bacteroides fragilis TaxID=817 RepID=UPI002030A907|nr:hypothetical protein [Bacteroides fragilis]MCM0237668.1 hypothetical protein [Bacteroides fragilis]
MEDCREIQFREIQKIVDACIQHDYKTVIDAFSLKGEYLNESQLKDYLRQEIFRITENVVKLRQTYCALRSIHTDMEIHDFLWESSFYEDLTIQERKKYMAFECAKFDMEKYSQQPTAYDDSLPYLSSILLFIVSSKYLNYLQQQEEKLLMPTVTIPIAEPNLPKEEQSKPVKILGKSNPFKANFSPKEIALLTDCVNEARVFTTSVTTSILKNFFDCKLDGVLKSNNNRLLAYLMMKLSCYDYITYEWQSVIANNQLVYGKTKDKYLTRTDLSTANDNVKFIEPKGHEIIDKYIKELKKG